MQHKIAMVFPGQGSQYPSMGKDLADAFTEAKEVFLAVDEYLGRKLSQIIFFGNAEELAETHNTQPAIMALSMALLAVLKKQINFDTSTLSLVAGHSLGEYSALCAADYLDLPTTTRLLKTRGNAMHNNKVPGKMLALIGADFTEAQALCQVAQQVGIIVIANDNGAGQIVLSGMAEAIDMAAACYKDFTIKKAIPLKVSQAFHSPLMETAAIEMEHAWHNVTVQQGVVPIIHNTTAVLNNDKGVVAAELVKQVTNTVRWRETMDVINKENIDLLVEVGPGSVLCNLMQRAYPHRKCISFDDIKNVDEAFGMLSTRV